MPKIGVDCTAYVDTAMSGSFPGTPVELESCQDVSINSDVNPVDVSVRGVDLVQYIAGLKDVEISLTCLYDPDDTQLVAMMAAHTARTPIWARFMKGDDATTGDRGWQGTYGVFGMSEPEPLADALVIEFTLKPFKAPSGEQHQLYTVP